MYTTLGAGELSNDSAAQNAMVISRHNSVENLRWRSRLLLRIVLKWYIYVVMFLIDGDIPGFHGFTENDQSVTNFWLPVVPIDPEPQLTDSSAGQNPAERITYRKQVGANRTRQNGHLTMGFGSIRNRDHCVSLQSVILKINERIGLQCDI